MRFAHRGVPALFACLLVACGGGDSSGPPDLAPEFVSGIWDINVTGCLNGALPVRLVATSTGALTSAQNAWTNSEDLGFFRPLDGTVDLSSGAAEFHMWSGGDHDSAVLFVGTLASDGSLSGTVTDPMPGEAPIFHFSGSPICTATGTGHRR